MAGFKYLHAADLHIDSPMLGLERYPEAPVNELRGATRRAFENLVQLAVEEQVAFVVLAGDLFDESWRDYNTGFFFCRQLAILERAGIRVFIIHGNHDAAGDMVKRLRWPANTFVFGAEAPHTEHLTDLGVALHGQSFPRRDVTSNLAARYPARVPGAFNIGLLHTALEGRDGHAAYAPCALGDLYARGYEYWALGHIHRREVVSDAPAHVVFPGNLQGRSVRETGPKGCSVVTVQDGRVVSIRHEALDVVRWERVEVDASGLVAPEDVVDRVAEALAEVADGAGGRLLAARVRVTGATVACAMRAEPERWRNELIVRLLSVAPDRVWLEKLVLDLRPPHQTRPEAGEGLALLGRLLQDLAEPDEGRPDFVSDLERKAGAELARDGVQSLFDPASLAQLRSEAVELLRARLEATEGGR
ncbi:MAG: DNA repair exonuclease [Myxococcaceae bacterium]|nr:DNA repair exonuclease [Myxococcaceae bacterium]